MAAYPGREEAMRAMWRWLTTGGTIDPAVSHPSVDGAGSSSGFPLARTAVKTSNYTAAANDLVPVDTTSGAVTVTLPTAPADKTLIAVKHIIQGGTNAVSVACAGSDVFNRASGATTGTLSLSNQAMLLEYDSAGAIWTVLADDQPLSQLDLRFATLASASTITANDQTGTTYTLVLGDAGKIVRCTNASAVTLTVPTNASVAFSTGTIVNVYAGGAGGTTIAAAGGVTIRNNSSALVQYQEVSLRKDGTDEWVRVG